MDLKKEIKVGALTYHRTINPVTLFRDIKYSSKKSDELMEIYNVKLSLIRAIKES